MGMDCTYGKRGFGGGRVLYILRIIMSITGMDELLGYYIYGKYTKQEKGNMLLEHLHRKGKGTIKV
jgi:hypothetical protein